MGIARYGRMKQEGIPNDSEVVKHHSAIWDERRVVS